jgi:hypothetical protein
VRACEMRHKVVSEVVFCILGLRRRASTVQASRRADKGSVDHARRKTKLELRQKNRVDVRVHTMPAPVWLPSNISNVLVGRKVCV